MRPTSNTIRAIVSSHTNSIRRCGPALGGPGCDVRVVTFVKLHVFRNLVRICVTFQMTLLSPLALSGSRTSTNLLGLIGGGRWHRSRVPRVLPEHHTLCAVISTCGLLHCHSAAFATPHSYHMFRVDVDHHLTLCRHLRATDSCLFAIIRHPPTRLGSTREKVHGSCMVGRV